MTAELRSASFDKSLDTLSTSEIKVRIREEKQASKKAIAQKHDNSFLRFNILLFFDRTD